MMIIILIIILFEFIDCFSPPIRIISNDSTNPKFKILYHPTFIIYCPYINRNPITISLFYKTHCSSIFFYRQKVDTLVP